MTPKGKHHSPEARAKMRESQKRRLLNPAARAKLSNALKGRTLSPEHRARISESKKGHHHSPETRARLSEIQKGKYISPETRAKISEAGKGKRHSPETRAKISEALRGEKHPSWKGGRNKDKHGYIRINAPDHPRARSGAVSEHILVWEQAHCRLLPLDWVVHHINGIRDDNRPENLLAVPKSNHHYALLLQGLRAHIRRLEAENKRLKLQGKFWGNA